MNEPIDLVYLWCDDADPRWRAKRLDAVLRVGGNLSPYAAGDCRFRGGDDLRMALRSAEKYAPWVRRTYVVMDDDASPPAWMRMDADGLRIVRHGEFMPADFLPCFDSIAIECFLFRIGGLSERFLLANDDMMFGRACKPDFFFARDGWPICRFGVRRGVRKGDARYTAYHACMENAERLIRASVGLHGDFAKAYGRAPHHNVDAYRKDVMAECFGRFRDAFESGEAMRFPFRTEGKILRTVFSYYGMATGRAHFRRAPFNAAWNKPWWRWLLPSRGESLQFYGPSWKVGERRLAQYRPTLFCFNDGPQTTEAERRWLADFYVRRFPGKSRFEK